MDLGIISTGGEDFDDTLIVIEMEPSELSQEDYPFTVKVVADDINEAIQNFILILRLNSTIHRESVDTARRNSTRCIIRDDDRMSVNEQLDLDTIQYFIPHPSLSLSYSHFS